MQIIRLCYPEFECWKRDISQFIKGSVLANFKNSRIPEDYFDSKSAELKNYLKNKSAILFFAVEEKVLGMAWCHEIMRFDKRRLHIAHIAVLDECQGQGVGSALLKKVEKYAMENGYSGIDLMVSADASQAVGFYKKNNFEIERFLMKRDF